MVRPAAVGGRRRLWQRRPMYRTIGTASGAPGGGATPASRLSRPRSADGLPAVNLPPLLRAMRPHQWVKNSFVLAGLVAVVAAHFVEALHEARHLGIGRELDPDDVRPAASHLFDVARCLSEGLARDRPPVHALAPGARRLVDDEDASPFLRALDCGLLAGGARADHDPIETLHQAVLASWTIVRPASSSASSSSS